MVDKSIMVYAPQNLRIERALQRDNTSREDIVNRINSQLPDETKRNGLIMLSIMTTDEHYCLRSRNF